MQQTYAKIEPYLVLAARFVLGAIFIYAGGSKIIHSAAFAKTVYHYQILPDFLINSFAVVLPWIEVLTGGLLIVGIWLPGAVVCANLMLILFLTALSIAVARGLDIDCGCFATSRKELINIETIVRDLGFICISGYLFFIEFFRRHTAKNTCGFPEKQKRS